MLKANHPLRSASWMWAGAGEFLHNSYCQYRKDFDLKKVPGKAPFYITADQQYMLYVNGQYVGRGPARGYQTNWPFDEYDLAAILRQGHNWISIVGYNAGCSTYGYLHQRAAGILCAGDFGIDVSSGKGWEGRIDPAHVRDTARLSVQINYQEQFDARKDDRAWITAARLPKDFVSGKRSVRPYGSMPWHDLEERGMPNLGNEWLPYDHTCTTASGPCGDGYENWFNIAHGFHAEQPKLKWRPAAPGVRRKQGLQITLPGAGKNKLVATTVDLGQLAIGTFNVIAEGAAAGDIVDFYFCEALNPDGSPIVTGPGQGCEASMAIRLILRSGGNRFEAFQQIGHRYLVAIARNTNRPIKLTLAYRNTSYPLAIKGSFNCSDPVLNEIYNISVRTQQVCMMDTYVDTPWREQAQWWGDARVQVQNTVHLSGDMRMLARGIRSIGQQEVPNGLTYGHAPTMAHHCILPDFSLIWIITIWDYYHQTRDLSIFKQQWPRVQKVLSYFRGEGVGKSGLLQYDPRYWLFMDWSTIQKTGTPTLLNLWYVYTLQKLVELARATGMASEARWLSALLAKQTKLVNAKLFDRKAGLFRDGILPDGKPSRLHSIHCQTLAIMTGLQPQAHQNMIDRRLLPYLRGKKVEGGQPSSYWVTYVYGVMRQRGYGKDVIAHLRHNWEPMIPYGGTWETFADSHIGPSHKPVIGHGTTSHAWAAHPIYHLMNTLGGVAQIDHAWKRVSFAPVFSVPGVNDVAATIPTPHGLIHASWKRDGRTVHVQLSLPKGVAAAISLPGIGSKTVTGKNVWSIVLPHRHA